MEVLQLGHHPGSKKLYLSQARFCPPCLARTGFFSIETLETKKRTVNKYMFFVENMVGGRLKLDLDLGLYEHVVPAIGRLVIVYGHCL